MDQYRNTIFSVFTRSSVKKKVNLVYSIQVSHVGHAYSTANSFIPKRYADSLREQRRLSNKFSCTIELTSSVYINCTYHLLDWWWTRLGTDCHLSYFHDEVWKLICYFINNTFLCYFFILEEQTCFFILNRLNIFERFQMSWMYF